MRRIAVFVLSGALGIAIAHAQQATGGVASTCASGTAQPATPPAKGTASGTDPGSSGSTGWSGGTGGSFIGTTSAGATQASPTFQPATARGLDPIKGMPAAAKC